MKKFNRIAVPGILLLTAALVAVLPGPRWTVIGYLRREPFHEGRPLSYWRGQLAANLEAITLGHEPDEAAWAFKSFGTRGVPALVDGLKDGDPAVRRRAATLLGKLGPQAAEAVPALVEALQDADNEVCHQAILALERVGRPAPTVLAALKTVARGRGPNRIYASQALWHMEHQAAVVLPILIAGLRVDDPLICAQSLDVLDEMGGEARESVPALVQLCIHDSFLTADRAQDILQRLDPDGEATVKHWPVFSSKAGRFSIRLPGTPEESHDAIATRSGPVSETTYEIRFAAHRYAVTCYSGWPVDLPPSAKPEQGLDALVAAEKKSHSVREERKIVLGDGYPGRELVLVGDAVLVREICKRFYWVKGRLYELYVSRSRSEARPFMDSFRLLEP